MSLLTLYLFNITGEYQSETAQRANVVFFTQWLFIKNIYCSWPLQIKKQNRLYHSIITKYRTVLIVSRRHRTLVKIILVLMEIPAYNYTTNPSEFIIYWVYFYVSFTAYCKGLTTNSLYRIPTSSATGYVIWLTDIKVKHFSSTLWLMM